MKSVKAQLMELEQLRHTNARQAEHIRSLEAGVQALKKEFHDALDKQKELRADLEMARNAAVNALRAGFDARLAYGELLEICEWALKIPKDAPEVTLSVLAQRHALGLSRMEVAVRRVRKIEDASPLRHPGTMDAVQKSSSEAQADGRS
jgi:hypothetical protein